MATRLPASITGALSAEQRPDALYLLVTVSDPVLEQPLRYTDGHQVMLDMETGAYGVVSDGDTFRSVLVAGLLPDDGEDRRQETEITLSALDPDVIPELRSLSGEASVDIALCLSTDPDTRFMVVSGLQVLGRRYDRETATLTVARYGAGGRAAASDEPLVALRQTRQNVPGLHQ